MEDLKLTNIELNTKIDELLDGGNDGSNDEVAEQIMALETSVAALESSGIVLSSYFTNEADFSCRPSVYKTFA